MPPAAASGSDVSHGILDEIYYPTIDRPQTRNMELIFTDGETLSTSRSTTSSTTSDTSIRIHAYELGVWPSAGWQQVARPLSHLPAPRQALQILDCERFRVVWTVDRWQTTNNTEAELIGYLSLAAELPIP